MPGARHVPQQAPESGPDTNPLPNQPGAYGTPPAAGSIHIQTTPPVPSQHADPTAAPLGPTSGSGRLREHRIRSAGAYATEPAEEVGPDGLTYESGYLGEVSDTRVKRMRLSQHINPVPQPGKVRIGVGN